MLFNSFEYLVFLPLAFLLYWLVFAKHLKLQNLLLVILSYIFYGWWDWRFLFLIFLSTVIDFIVGIKLGQGKKQHRKIWLSLSILVNLGALGFFKYFNFFIESFARLLQTIGYAVKDPWMLEIILPVGISFYTFQTMSYSIDVYKKKVVPTKDFIAFAAFVSFFPQLVAGPIERASSLLPQILKHRKFDYRQGVEGLRLILWGFFKKMAIADAIAPIVDDIFSNYQEFSSPVLILGVVLFSFQIYCDFSGYSDIAIGTAKLFGLELMSNFKFPYFSRNIAEFWRRWHISLSTWFRDYLYIPLGGSRGSKWLSLRNILVIFTVSGLWHGANWTFVIWGGIHALLFIPVFLADTNRKYVDLPLAGNHGIPSIVELMKILLTFTLVTLAWVFFRADNLNDAIGYLSGIFANFGSFTYHHPLGYRMLDYFILLSIFLLYEYRIRFDERNPVPFNSKLTRFLTYTILCLGILLFYDDHADRSFIYFQF